MARSEMGSDPALARSSNRTRSDVRMLRSSIGSSKEIVISSGSLSPRSNFSARLRTRRKNSSLPPVLMVTLFFFIFEPPQLLDFADEPFNQGGISRRLNGRSLLRHRQIVPQMGFTASWLIAATAICNASAHGVSRAALWNSRPVGSTTTRVGDNARISAPSLRTARDG